MTLGEAVRVFEADFTVNRTAGFSIDGTDRMDMGRAPTGDEYVLIVSGGEISLGEAMPAWFSTEADAARAWLREAWAYAESQGGSTLYWREPPVLKQSEFVSLDQAGLMADPIMRPSTNISVSTVISRLFVSNAKKSPQPVIQEQASAAEVIEKRGANLPPRELGRGKSKRH